MAFSFNRTDFVETRDYNEVEHGKALQHGIVDFVGDGLDIVGTTITNGRGINNGVPFIIGRDGETESVSGFTGFLYIKTVLNKLNSISSFEKETIEQISTDTVKWFKIYDITSGVVDQDYRHINYVKDFSILPTGNPDEIKFSLNGFETEPFNISVLGGTLRVVKLFETAILDSDFSGLIFDQAINLIASNILKPFILEDNIDTNNYPILNQIFRDRFQNASAFYSIEYRCPSSANPGNLVITPNQLTNEFRLKTDNYVTPITKYGDFCKEITNLSVLQAENVGKYIDKLQDPTSQTITMKFIGDSLTRGFDNVNGSPTTYVGDDGTTRTDTLVVDIAYPEKVETTFEVMYPQHTINHINNGWSGGNIGDINTHYFADNGEDICVIMIGTNDSSGNPSTIKEFREGLMQQVELRLSQGSAVVLVQPIQKLERRGYAIKPFKAEIKKIAEEYNLGLIDGQEMLSNADYEKYSDGVHLNQDGYNLFGIKMACALSTDGVLTSFKKFKSGEFFPFMTEEIFYGGDRQVGYGEFYPTLQLKDVGGGTYGGTSKFIQPGETLSIPIYLSERNMYIIPQIYRATVANAGDIRFNLNLNIAESFSNFYLTSVDGTNYQFGVDGKYNTSARVLLEDDFSAGGVTSLANYIETSSITNNFICSPSKGWCLLTLYNISTVSYTMHGIDIISSFDYQGITGKKLMSRTNPITLF